jgi:hypothetical protein
MRARRTTPRPLRGVERRVPNGLDDEHGAIATQRQLVQDPKILIVVGGLAIHENGIPSIQSEAVSAWNANQAAVLGADSSSLGRKRELAGLRVAADVDLPHIGTELERLIER